MEQKFKIPNFKEDDDATIENIEPPMVQILSSSKTSEDWEKISEDWVSLYLEPPITDHHSRSLPSDLESDLQSNSTLSEKNKDFSLQDQLANSLMLYSTNDQRSHSDMLPESSLDVMEDLSGKEDSAPQIHSKSKPKKYNNSTFLVNNLSQVSEISSSEIEVDLWKDKETNPNLLMMSKQEMNAEVSSDSKEPTSFSTIATSEESRFANNFSLPSKALQSSSYLLQYEDGEIGSQDLEKKAVSSSSSIGQVEIPSILSQSNFFCVQHLQSISNTIKVGLLGISRDRDRRTNAQNKNNFEVESFKLQNQEVPKDQQNDYNNGYKKRKGGDKNNEKQRIWLVCNCKSGQFSRQKKIYMDELEDKLQTMAAIMVELNITISHLAAQNVNLRKQLGYYYPAPSVYSRLGMPMHTMLIRSFLKMVTEGPMYSSGYMPLVPIPHIKVQALACNSKRSKFGTMKKIKDRKKTKMKAVGVLSMATMGLICLVMLFGSINHGFNGFNGIGNCTCVENLQFESHWLTSSNKCINPLNSTKVNLWDFGPQWLPLELRDYGSKCKGIPSVHIQLTAKKLQYENEKSEGIIKAKLELFVQHLIDGNAILATSISPNYFNLIKAILLTDNEAIPINTSQLFIACAFIPSVNGLVKVDGNLIIQVVMASDKATKKLFVKKYKYGSKKKKRVKQFKSFFKLQAMKSLSLKALYNLTPKESNFSKNSTIAPFVTTKLMLQNENFIVKANNSILSLLQVGSPKQWMFGGLYGLRNEFVARKLAKKVKSQLPINNSKVIPAIQEKPHNFIYYNAISRRPMNLWPFSSFFTVCFLLLFVLRLIHKIILFNTFKYDVCI